MILDKTLFVYSSFSAEFYLLSASSNYEGDSLLFSGQSIIFDTS
jgi:hypothetical protein